jgi:hypothetical protein
MVKRRMSKNTCRRKDVLEEGGETVRAEQSNGTREEAM